MYQRYCCCLSVNRGMSHPECDSEPWACCHGNRERQLDTVLPGISEEEEQQCSHPPLVLLTCGCSPAPVCPLPSSPLPSRSRALSLSDCEDGHKENEAVRQLHPSFPPAKVPSLRGNGERAVPVADFQRDGGRPGFLRLQSSGDPQTQKHMEGVVQRDQHHAAHR